MGEKTTKIAEALDELGTAIVESHSDDQQLQELLGWNAPPLNRSDLANMATTLARKFRGADESEINPKYNEGNALTKISFFKNHIANFWNGNGIETYRAYVGLLYYLENQFSAAFVGKVNWDNVKDKSLLPKDLTRRLRSIDTQIKSASSKVEDIDQRIETINNAYTAAENLPTDMETLEDARKQVEKTRTSAEKNIALLLKAKKEADDQLGHVQKAHQDVLKLVESVEEAYSAATTKGLAEAFQTRADRTAGSMWIWVGGLLIALVAGAFASTYRLSALLNALEKNSSPGLVSFNIVLSLVSVGAPVWLAWVATKQIGHRFRLSEDYAYKASIAKAYEGYRREAVRVDPEEAKRLFSMTLDRLEEAPLRFVEHETYGSPWHEALWAKFRRNSLTNTQDEPKTTKSPRRRLPKSGVS